MKDAEGEIMKSTTSTISSTDANRPRNVDWKRAAALLWFSPESRSQWATWDSAMLRYAPRCTAVLEVRSARELEEAARSLVLHR